MLAGSRGPACAIARDLGGLPAGEGRTAFGVVIRSDGLQRLTDDGRRAMLATGVRTVIDLRTRAELRLVPSPCRDWDGYRPIPLLGDADADELAARFARQNRAECYPWTVERARASLADVLRAIAGAGPGGIVVHCQVGKDRTGIVAALLLSLAGCPPDVVVDDYLLSASRLAAAAGVEDPERRWYVEEPAMTRGLFRHLQARYGGVAGFLAQLGITERTQDTLRRRLLTAAQ
ncbi:MAG: tyrosine-protein phosphatase [Candidatus Dormiibacterota bacterium]